MRRNKRWFNVGILVLALVLRVVYLDSRSLEYDDAFSILLAERSLGEIIMGTAADTMPPLYYFLLHFWMMASRQLAFIRLLNIGLSLGIVWMSILLGKEVGGETVGWTAGVLTAVSPLQIFHAQRMRMYVVMTLATLVYLWFLVRLLAEKEGAPINRWNWIGLVLGGAAAMYSHNLAIFGLAAPNFVLLLQRRWQRLFQLILAQLAIGFVALPWLLFLPGQVAKIQAAFWTPKPGLVEIIQAIITFHTNLPVPDGFQLLAFLVSAWVLVFTMIEIRRLLPGETGIQLLFGVLFLPPAMLFVVSYLMRPVFVYRAMMTSSVVYYVLLAGVVLKTRVRMIGVSAVLAFVLSALAVLPAQYSFRFFPRSPFDEATSFLSSGFKTGDVIVHDNKLSLFPSIVYNRDLPQVFLPDLPGSHNQTLAPQTQEAMDLIPAADISSAVEGAERVWFVVFSGALMEYQALGPEVHPQLAWLETNFEFVQQQEFNDLFVYEFQAH